MKGFNDEMPISPEEFDEIVGTMQNLLKLKKYDWDLRCSILLALLASDFAVKTMNWREDKRNEEAEQYMRTFKNILGINNPELREKVDNILNGLN